MVVQFSGGMTALTPPRGFFRRELASTLTPALLQNGRNRPAHQLALHQCNRADTGQRHQHGAAKMSCRGTARPQRAALLEQRDLSPRNTSKRS